MRYFSTLVALAFVAGCGGGGGNDDGGLDASSDARDSGAVVQAAIGASCKKSSDCGAGMTCLTNPGGTRIAGGYCTKTCGQTADDCGDTATCVDFFGGGTPPYCYATCTDSTDCRQDDHHGCWTLPQADGTIPDTGACFISLSTIGFSLCDPTAGDGTCDLGGGFRGICARYQFGTANAGICNFNPPFVPLPCTLGIGTCPDLPPDQNNPPVPHQCVVNPNAWTAIPPLFPDDAFQGAVCEPVLSNPPAPGPGLECLYPNPNNGGALSRFIDACTDGYECDLNDGPNNTIDPSGDNRCRALCYPDGPPSDVSIPDGGTLPPTCDGECRRVFGNDVNFGLCIPGAGGTPDGGADQGIPDQGTPDEGVDAGNPDQDIDAGNPDQDVDAGTTDGDTDGGTPT
jgi:hypothetical protein